MDKVDLYSFLSRYRYGVVSSISADGTPQSALVGIAVSQELEIIFDTVTSSRKYPNLIARPAWSDGAESRRCSSKGTLRSRKGPTYSDIRRSTSKRGRTGRCE